MHLYDIDSGGEPLESPHGERVWELTGLGVAGTTDRHSLAHVAIPQGGATLNHFHPEAEETYYILSGGGLMIVDDEEAAVGPGDTIFIAPNQKHKLINTGVGELQLLAVCVPA